MVLIRELKIIGVCALCAFLPGVIMILLSKPVADEYGSLMFFGGMIYSWYVRRVWHG